MQPTNYPQVNAILDDLQARMHAVLGTKLVGLYLFGSLVAGDFDPDLSDIDLLVATASDIDDADFAALDQMQNDVATKYKAWEGRLEIAYLSLEALRTFKTQRTNIGMISPGEPFHIKDAGSDYLMNWYVVREKGLTLYGPPPGSIIAPVSKEEFIEAVKEHVRGWREWVNDMHRRGAQAYAILTLCRALYAFRNGEQTSKIQAAAWAEKELPEWSTTIKNAVRWRQAYREQNVDHDATFDETRRFVYDVIGRILG